MSEIKKNRKEINQIKRSNAKLYPIYKMFSWDLLFFYSIEFLFYTMTKGITASQLLIVDAFYILFEIICQIPAVAICDLFGRKKALRTVKLAGLCSLKRYRVTFRMNYTVALKIYIDCIPT